MEFPGPKGGSQRFRADGFQLADPQLADGP